CFCIPPRPPPSPTLFPYTTLFRSELSLAAASGAAATAADPGDRRERQRKVQSVPGAAPARRGVPQRGGGRAGVRGRAAIDAVGRDRKSTRLNSSHVKISYAVFCLK